MHVFNWNFTLYHNFTKPTSILSLRHKLIIPRFVKPYNDMQHCLSKSLVNILMDEVNVDDDEEI